MTSLRWYVVQTRPRAEEKAVQNLLRQGFRAYLPRYLKQRRHARRLETVPAPLFPRYLFVAFDIATERWRSIQSTLGVISLVFNGDGPAVVPAGIVEQIKSSENARGFIELKNGLKFRRGDKIHIMGGVFEELSAVLDRVDDGSRVTVLLELLGRRVRVMLDSGCIAAA
jgi:transcriptional antiterminator RfaH